MAKKKLDFINTLTFARQMDRKDPLRKFRNRFHYPNVRGKSTIYFTGNSLGLQPKSAKRYIEQELNDWALLGVEGHVHAKRPWMKYSSLFKKSLARLVGAKPIEVAAMNQLTVNLHLLMVSFYRPTASRNKIIIEAGAFSSDQYAVESQVKFYGYDPKETIIEVLPPAGAFTLKTEDILSTIQAHGDEVALVLFGGVQYYTGQFFDIKKITEAGHAVGALVGFDLAHAIGNVKLSLNKHKVDFAVWCTYKYLNSGPGAISGIYINEKYALDKSLRRFAGWWGYQEEDRFQMKSGFKPMLGADGWQLSNTSVMHAAAHLASLEIFDEAGMPALTAKSKLLTGYAIFVIKEIDPLEETLKIITPTSWKDHGCQLSIYVKKSGKELFKRLSKAGIVADWREPNVIRIAPTPLYNSFEEVFTFGSILKRCLSR